ncbi:TetR/AcrR family transcriptional regulator [Microbulbifer sp. OS29]|uniref:TetR/AcrR family transcriptional regulator n=1 Tax=Microbulbifer okhotskensis TaxID=2926617 RepID=A0A9X2EQ53_9GAMM|nr:TetR/AcrR family transcriptional regulator [Microbulbifer okhotskensis]MCO1335300.1 TetR/AcrR family transcriptional regulator [Microbulbifer okhotskensis]
MSGRKQFDESEVLDKAMRVFWEQGYKATSLSDLESAMGLNKSSIYNAFHSKEVLYGRCLEHFQSQYACNAMDTLDHPDFRIAMGSFLEMLQAGMESSDTPEGCIATMAAMEVGASEGFLADLVAKGSNDMLERIETRMKQAIEDGQLKADTDCAALAALVMAVSRGVVALNKGTGNNTAGKRSYQQLTAILDQYTHS